MFQVDSETKKITMHRGDTGEITVTLNGYDFSNVDCKALFTMKYGGETIKEDYYDIDENNQFVVEFTNPDTDIFTSANAEYDVRVIIDPVWDENGKIVNGTMVRTPDDPIACEIRRTVGIV